MHDLITNYNTILQINQIFSKFVCLQVRSILHNFSEVFKMMKHREKNSDKSMVRYKQANNPQR